MKITYDPLADVINIDLTDKMVVNSKVDCDAGIIILYDAEGRIVSLEIDDASEWVQHPDRVEFEVYEYIDELEPMTQE